MIWFINCEGGSDKKVQVQVQVHTWAAPLEVGEEALAIAGLCPAAKSCLRRGGAGGLRLALTAQSSSLYCFLSLSSCPASSLFPLAGTPLVYQE